MDGTNGDGTIKWNTVTDVASFWIEILKCTIIVLSLYHINKLIRNTGAIALLHPPPPLPPPFVIIDDSLKNVAESLGTVALTLLELPWLLHLGQWFLLLSNPS